MSYPTHLIRIKSHFYYKIKVPSDLRHFFPCTFIKSSLKTTDLNKAKTLLIAKEYKVHEVFTLLRTGMLQEDMFPLIIQSVMTPKQKTARQRMTLSTVINQYVTDMKGGWTAKTKMESDGVFRLIIDLMEDVPIESIDRGRVRSFRDKLLKLPPNVYKVYSKLSPLEVIEQVDSGKLKADPMSLTSVNKHISRLFSLMAFCIKEGHRTDNPASEMNIKQKKRADEERKAYSLEDLQKMTKHLPRNDRQPERFYVPMVCMLSGMRLDEA